ncbi:MAG: helicase C-terminal domain-containing protein [Candidatus Sumerlaeaceae bacterium]
MGTIAQNCAASLRQLIAECGGQEVFAIGTCDDAGEVIELDPLAFGNWDAVPAPAQNARPGQVLIHNHPSGTLDPSDADINIASLYGKSGVGFYIVDNMCEQVRVVVKPFREAPAVELDVASLLRHFGPDGDLARRMPGYEHRPQQLQMMQLVANAFNRDRLAVAEAGTGTGKSFAYLAPAIAWAQANKKRVVISTNTINLQEQLINKDVPELRTRLDWNFRAVLVKGRNNYISRRRLKFAAREGELFPDERSKELKQLLEWSGATNDGSRSDLPFDVADETWEAAASDKDDCLRARCPHFNDCFFYKSRREAASADVIVANHHLVMADIALKKENTGNDYTAILPPYDRLVFDEAHNLEEVATSYFSSETSLLAIRRQLNRLATLRENKGAIPRLQRAVFEHDSRNVYAVTAQILTLLDSEVLARRHELEPLLEEHFSDVFHRTLEFFHMDSLNRTERRELRITRTVTESPYWRETGTLLEEIRTEMNRLLSPLDKALNLMRHYPEELLLELADYRTAAGSVAAKLTDHCNAITFFLKAGDEDYCRWFDVGYVRDRPVVRPCTAPLDIAPALRSALFTRKRTVILTSATLTVDNKFDYLSRQLGLGAAEVEESASDQQSTLEDVAGRTDYLKVGTPFDYERNCLIGIPRDLPPPNDRQFEEHIAPVIVETLRITQGRAFVLFTSYRSLQKALALTQSQLQAMGITTFRQGEMPRHRLLEAFRSSSRAALFATSSFWEGVDVQGRALECLILTKLPFSVPTTPILEARAEHIDRRGGSSFYEMTVPMAVIKFKQGFGRLIRSKTDRGIVVILDHRVVTKPYGKTFLRSLPPARVQQGTTAEVLETLTSFY